MSLKETYSKMRQLRMHGFYSQGSHQMMICRRFGLPVFEYACHEGNIGMAGILAGARVQEIRPTAAGLR